MVLKAKNTFTLYLYFINHLCKVVIKFKEKKKGIKKEKQTIRVHFILTIMRIVTYQKCAKNKRSEFLAFTNIKKAFHPETLLMFAFK